MSRVWRGGRDVAWRVLASWCVGPPQFDHGVNNAMAAKSGAVQYRMGGGDPLGAKSSRVRMQLFDRYHGLPSGKATCACVHVCCGLWAVCCPPSVLRCAIWWMDQNALFRVDSLCWLRLHNFELPCLPRCDIPSEPRIRMCHCCHDVIQAFFRATSIWRGICRATALRRALVRTRHRTASSAWLKHRDWVEFVDLLVSVCMTGCCVCVCQWWR